MNPSLIGYFALTSFGAVDFAVDLLDAPGPGYRTQTESLRSSSTSPSAIRFQVFHDAFTPTRLQRLEPFRIDRINLKPLPDVFEIQRPNPTNPELPTTNPFEEPIRLFDAK